MDKHRTKIYVFYCATGYDLGEIARGASSGDAELKFIALPCSGKLDILYLTKAFETDADGVALMMCKEGECRYLEGNLRAKKRIEAVARLIDEAGFGRGRVVFIQMDEGGIATAVRKMEDFCAGIKAMSIAPGQLVRS